LMLAGQLMPMMMVLVALPSPVMCCNRLGDWLHDYMIATIVITVMITIVIFVMLVMVVTTVAIVIVLSDCWSCKNAGNCDGAESC
jgi:hypothetical protein